MRKIVDFLWSPAVRWGVGLYAVLRVGLSVWVALVLIITGAETGPHPVLRPYAGIDPLKGDLAGWLVGPWQRFDTLHYVHIAMVGYQPDSAESVFPPLYPLLIRGLGELLGGREWYLLAALLISNAACLGYYVVFFILAQAEVGDQDAARALVYMTLYPWAFFLMAGYAESLFLLLVTLAFLLARRSCGWGAGACGLLAALTRLPGSVLALPLLLEVVRRRGKRLWPPGWQMVWPLRMDLVWPALPVLGSLGFLIGRTWAGIEPLTITYITHWHHLSAPPWMGMVVNLRNMLAGVAHSTDYLDFAAAWLAITLAVGAWWRLSPAYALYMSATTLFNLSHLRTPHPMCSVGRHTIELFPGFFILGQLGRRSPWLNRLFLYPSFALLLYLSGQFVVWGWVG